MKTFTYYLCIFILGIMIGYSWCFYHGYQIQSYSSPESSWYKEKINSWIPADLSKVTKVKTKNYNLREKTNG